MILKYTTGRRPSQLRVENCADCKWRNENKYNFPCNRCFSRNANCVEQHYEERRAQDDKKPFMGLPLSETEKLMVETEQLTYENARLRQKLEDVLVRLNQLENYVMRGRSQSYEEKRLIHEQQLAERAYRDQLQKEINKMSKRMTEKMTKGDWYGK